MLAHNYKALSQENAMILRRQNEILKRLGTADPPFWDSQSGLITIGALITFISFLAFALVLYILYQCDKYTQGTTRRNSSPSTYFYSEAATSIDTIDLPPPYSSCHSPAVNSV